MADNIIGLGDEAAMILKSEAFKIAIARVKESAFDQFLRTTHDQKQERDSLWAMATATDAVETALSALADSARLEKENLKEK